MEIEQFFGMRDKGTKNFTQWDVPSANATGFGAAADDYMERGIDLNEQLIRNKPATFFMRVSGDAMTGAGIFNGDVVIVDRSAKAANGKVVIATLNGEMLIRRLEKTFNKIRLIPETPRLSPIEVDLSGSEFSIWGVVTYVIHSL
jgi:DNA polymerase V